MVSPSVKSTTAQMYKISENLLWLWWRVMLIKLVIPTHHNTLIPTSGMGLDKLGNGVGPGRGVVAGTLDGQGSYSCQIQVEWAIVCWGGLQTVDRKIPCLKKRKSIILCGGLKGMVIYDRPQTQHRLFNIYKELPYYSALSLFYYGYIW